MTIGQQARDSLNPGHMLLWYKIEKVLGKGGFGITYLAHDINLDKRVAIKEYLPSDIAVRNSDHTVQAEPNSTETYESGLNRFIREARTMAKFEHPNIVRILNVFEENNTAYMAMAYEEGKDLKELITPKKTLPEDDILRIILPILDGLEMIHDAGFIHRDIKPSNIMIRKDGTPVLIDFGSAHDTKRASSQITTLVSPGFTPHEQYTGDSESQGPWTDIYSLGATLYRCIAGVNPVDALTRGGAIIKQLGDPLVSAKDIGVGKYNQAFLEAIDCAVEFNDRDRARDIASWRNQLIGDEQVTITQTSTGKYQFKGDKLGDTQEMEIINTREESKPSEFPFLTAVSVLVVGLVIAFFLVLNDSQQNDELIASTEPTTEVEPVVQATPVEQITINDEASEVAINEPAEQAIAEIEIDIDALVPALEQGTIITDTLKDGSHAPDMVVLSTGSYLIGSRNDEEGRRSNEGPQRQIHFLKPIAIGKTEITVGQFKQFVDDTSYVTDAERNSEQGCRIFENGWNWKENHNWREPGYPQTDDHPVVCVSWNDAIAYVDWLSKQTGEFYNLPSESEWEYAARSGSDMPRFWESDRKTACKYANVSDLTRATMHNLDGSGDNIFICEDGFTYSAPVGNYAESPYGLHDVLGNVWEWTADCWNDSYNGLPLNGKARLTGNCDNRIYRGGSWGNYPNLIRAAKRGTDPRDFRYYNVGFRISRVIAESTTNSTALN